MRGHQGHGGASRQRREGHRHQGRWSAFSPRTWRSHGALAGSGERQAPAAPSPRRRGPIVGQLSVYALRVRDRVTLDADPGGNFPCPEGRKEQSTTS
eukprot:9479745-Pyramimonas_sp.AAC.1